MNASVVSGDITGVAGRTMLAVFAAADRRPKIKRITIACTGTVADAMAWFQLGVITTAGTSTAVTPKPIDAADGATVTCTAGKNFTAEPTFNRTLDEFVLHERATGIFEPPPGVTWTCPLGATNGVALNMISANTKNYRYTMEFEE